MPISKREVEVKTTRINFQDTHGEEFHEPSKFFVRDGLGDHVYFHCRTRDAAQAACDEMYGKGKYLIRTTATIKPRGDVSARGTNSRKGFTYLKKR
jgi:hypothetical protein